MALGLGPSWRVTDVRFEGDPKELHLFLDFDRGTKFPCPHCAVDRNAYDTNSRVWRHLNFFQHKTYLHADLPRIDCPSCGVKVIDVPWARERSGFTLLFEAMLLVLAKQMPVAAVGRFVGEYDTRIWRVLEHYVELARLDRDMCEVERIGIDETSHKSGHQYVTVFADLDTSSVLFVTDGKGAETVSAFREDFIDHAGQPADVNTVCMDLSPAFQSGVSIALPNAKMIFDRFHVVKLANEAVDAIRRAEVKTNDILKQTRYLWLSGPVRLSKMSQKHQEKLSVMQGLNLATAQAYQMKLNLLELWTLPDREAATAHLESWYAFVEDSSGVGAPLQKLAKTIKSHQEGILNFFPNRLTSGLMEGINSLIQAAKSKARGYRTTRYMKIAIYLIAGKLQFNLPT